MGDLYFPKDATKETLVKFVKKVYSLSTPVGRGHLHFVPGDLSDEDAKKCICEKPIMDIVVNMDYVRGRACKMYVRIDENGRYNIADWWPDHSKNDLAFLVECFGLQASL